MVTREITRAIRLAKKNLSLMTGLAVLFVLVNALSIFLIRSETERNRLLMESTSSRTASLLLEVFFEQGITEDPGLVQGVVGFGVYGESGSAVLRQGSAPAILRPTPASDEEALYIRNRERGTLIQIRAIAMPAASIFTMPLLLGRLTSRYLYLETDVTGYLRRQAWYSAALAAVPVVITLLTALVGSFALKNAAYREQIATQERLARLGEAARTLAHELKNPLNVIKLRARIIRKTAGPEAAADVDVIEEEVDHLAGLTDRIREFLQDPRGTPEPIELEGFARNMAARSQWNVAMSTDGTGSYLVSFDPSRLRSVLENLIRNARESMEQDATNSPTPEVRLRHNRAAVVLSVLDRGPGIQAADTERVFDPFFTTKATGSGIGLSISRRFVEAAGGTIALLPREGGGTEARVTLTATEGMT